MEEGEEEEVDDEEEEEEEEEEEGYIHVYTCCWRREVRGESWWSWCLVEVRSSLSESSCSSLSASTRESS